MCGLGGEQVEDERTDNLHRNLFNKQDKLSYIDFIEVKQFYQESQKQAIPLLTEIKSLFNQSLFLKMRQHCCLALLLSLTDPSVSWKDLLCGKSRGRGHIPFLSFLAVFP